MKLQTDLREFIERLNSRGVEYLIVGGYALAFHGLSRFTGYIDILVRPDDANADRILAALSDFGFGAVGLRREDFTTVGRVTQLGRPPNRIDILTSISGVDIDDALAQRIPAELDGLSVFMIGRRHLIANKRASGRIKDHLDLEALDGRAI